MKGWGGQVRIRCDRGWTSLTSRASGKALLVEVSAAAEPGLWNTHTQGFEPIGLAELEQVIAGRRHALTGHD